jgi:hypothetical protein
MATGDWRLIGVVDWRLAGRHIVILDVIKNAANDVPKSGGILRARVKRTSNCYELDK